MRRWLASLDRFNQHLVFLIIITVALNAAYFLH